MAERGIDYLQGPTKRHLDVVGGLAIAGTLAPVAAATAVAAGIDTKHYNPILHQQRVGKGGRLMNVFKFRTLRDEAVKAEGDALGTYDPRATKVGLGLRVAGFDEIPQLANVLMGNMSLVGHRPLLESDLEKLHDMDPKLFEDWFAAYLETLPGITGPGQLYQHVQPIITDDVLRQTMRLDLGYAETATLGKDIRILGRTPLTVLGVTVQLIEGQLEAGEEPS